MIRSSPALQWVTLGSIVAYLGYNTGGMFVTGERTLCAADSRPAKPRVGPFGPRLSCLCRDARWHRRDGRWH